MDRNEMYKQSPLRILERARSGKADAAEAAPGSADAHGLGRGNVGVVMARAGVGKTAFLVHIALDSLLRERKVLHVSLDAPVDHVHSWYEAVFNDLARAAQLSDLAGTTELIHRNRIIQAYTLHGHGAGQSAFSVEKLGSSIALLAQHAGFKPDVLILDAFDWTRTNDKELEALCAVAKAHNLELWMTALTHRHQMGSDVPTGVPQPCDRFARYLQLVLFLQPVDGHLSVRLLKDAAQGGSTDSDTHLSLYPDTMRLVDDRLPNSPMKDLPPSAFTLLSGAAEGAEAEFGACAERYGLREENISFEGHRVVRTRGLRMLTDEELREGDVSLAYVSATMHRTYHQNATLRKVLQSIWHQVNSAQEVFIIGVIQPDGTVKGGTGWAAELARHQQKALHVFDQNQKGWFSWDAKARSWNPSRPVVSRTRFTGTGTRNLTPDGAAAIADLFQRSFGRSNRQS